MSKDADHASNFCQELRNAVKAAINSVSASMLTEVRAAKSLAALAGALRNLGEINGTSVTATLRFRNKPIDKMEVVANFIFAEMITNYNASISKYIAAANEAAAYESALSSVFLSMAAWTYKVMPEGEWDHKPKIVYELGLYSYDRATGRLYRWDIWSNIHYGFVGAAIGYSAGVLMSGASAANIISSKGMSLLEYGQGDDEYDQAAVLLGIDLWSKYGDSLEFETFLSSARDNAPSLASFECDYMNWVDG